MLRPRIRSVCGPLLVGLGVWCASGDLTVTTSASADLRLAIPAPAWVAIAATLAAALVPAWRRRPWLAAPATLATLPWWPLPLPAVALIWTGPLGWLAIGLAVFAAVAAHLGARPAASGSVTSSPTRATTIAGLLTLAVSLVVAWTLAPRLPDGDEPHYLIITESAIRDGDLLIENNHDRRDYASFFDGTLARPDYIQRAVSGEIYSIHAPGLSLLVLPLYWVFGYRGAQATVVLCVALAGALVWRIGWRATGDAPAAWFAWASIALCTTFLVQSVTIYPDGPGMLAAAAGVWLVVRLGQVRVNAARIVGVSVLMAGLPWLHSRFSVLAGALGALVVWQIMRDAQTPLAARWSRVAAFATIPMVSAIGWFTYFWVLYGTPNPAAPYGANTADTSWTFVPGALLGLLFDQQFGLFASAPVLVGSLVGLWANTDGRTRRLTRFLGVAALVYVAAIGTYWMWWAGVPAPPARFLTALLPVLAVPQALVWARATRNARLWWSALLVLSLAVTAIVLGVHRGELVWNVRDAHALLLDWAGPVVTLARGWPSFFWQLTPQVATSELPFALHVAVSLVIWTTAVVGGMALLRRQRADWPSGLVFAAMFALALMTFVQAGWWLTGVPGLNAANSQLRVLRSAANGAAMWRIGPLEVARATLANSSVEVGPDRSRVAEVAESEWARFETLPAGTYEMRVRTRRPGKGRLLVRAGRSQSLRVFEALPLTEQTFNFSLPVDVAGVTVEPDEALRSVGGEVSLRPRVSKPVVPGTVRIAAHYEAGDFFFFDDRAMPESDGFWVTGGTTAEFVVAADARARTLTLTLNNGGARNAVSLVAGSFTETATLEPFEARTVNLPPGPNGVTHVRLASPGGFRPSDDGKSGDSRYLGVRIK